MMIAALVATLGLVATVLWIGVGRRRRAEAEHGVRALARMKWRDATAVVLEALKRDGYEAADEVGGGTQTLLRQDRDKVLFDYKHGTSYCLGAAALAEFAEDRRRHGAERGILATLGSLEAGAAAAAGPDLMLLDGPRLWARVRPFLDDSVLEPVRAQARASIQRALWLGVGASLAIGALAFWFENAAPRATPVALAADASAPTPPASAANSASDPVQAPAATGQEAMLRQLHATAEALAEVERLSPEQLAQRRATVVRQVSQLPQVGTAAWSAQRTLVLGLNHTDGKDKALVEETCRIVLSNEEMRYTRIQLDPPTGSGLAVRWRLCE